MRLIFETIENLSGNNFEKADTDFLLKIFKNYIMLIKKNLISNMNLKDNGYEIFEEELRNYSKNPIGVIIDNIISRPFLLIPFNLEDVVEGNTN